LAAKLASADGINQTALAIRLNHSVLKQRVKAANGTAHRPPLAASSVPALDELGETHLWAGKTQDALGVLQRPSQFPPRRFLGIAALRRGPHV
jgi:hypothetical protein